jgi:LmbE family N-acetylglucosaminyl deacetylase
MHAGLATLLEANRPIFLDALRLSPDLRLVVLAPHPDDFDAMGVTLRFFRENGNRIEVAVLSSAASGVEDDFCPPATPALKAEVREREQRASCRFFGLPDNRLTFLRLQEDEEGQILETDKNVDHVRRYLAARRPDMVFLPHGNDTNADHRWTYETFRRTALEAGHPLVAFLIRDPKTVEMRHDLYTVFDAAAAEWKAELLRFHESQHQRSLNTRGYGFDERILRLDRAIAAELRGGGAPYAEVFELEFYGTSPPSAPAGAAALR